jgi:hypothetical protein
MVAFMILLGFIFMLKEELNISSSSIAHKMGMIQLDYDTKEHNAVAPQSVARGAPRSGDRAAAGMPDRTKIPMGSPQPATGSHLPSEDTAPPYAVSPERSPRGPAKRGSGSGGDARPHQNTDGEPTARYGHLPRKTVPSYLPSRPFYRNLVERDLFGGPFTGLHPRLIEAAFGIKIQQA